MNETCSGKGKDIGLVILRIGLGIMFVAHGLPKIIGGPEKWAGLGAALKVFGIAFAPAFWGFMASFAEFAGGVCLVLGVFFRPMLVLLIATMIVAASMLLNAGAGFTAASHAITVGIVFISMLFAGPSKLSLGAHIAFLKGKWYQ